MPTPIRGLENPPLHGLNPENGSRYYDGTVDFSKLAVGDLCYYHYKGVPCHDQEMLSRLHLTSHYFAHNAGRPPLILALPDHASSSPLYFLVDGQCYSNQCTRCGQGYKGHKDDRCADGGTWTRRGHYDGWTVTGVPPTITVHPSVNYDDAEFGVRHYHGFIQNGVIGDG